jgi:hypothetical protein
MRRTIVKCVPTNIMRFFYKVENLFISRKVTGTKKSNIEIQVIPRFINLLAIIAVTMRIKGVPPLRGAAAEVTDITSAIIYG